MSDRIDHAAEARRLVSATETRDWNQESPYIDRRLAAAQVHATLAAIELQRESVRVQREAAAIMSASLGIETGAGAESPGRRPVDLDTVERVAREGALRHSLRDQCSCDSCRAWHGPEGAPGRCGACASTEHGDVCADSTAYEAILTAMGIQ